MTGRNHLDQKRSPLHVVVVEDDLYLQTFYEIAVEAFLDACEIHVASNAYQALSILETLDPAVVVVDLHLPGMSGHEFISAAREKLSAKSARFIIISALERAEADALGRLPADALYLTKPVSVCEVLEAIAGSTSLGFP